MSKKSSLLQTETIPPQLRSSGGRSSSSSSNRRISHIARLGHVFVGFWAVLTGIATVNHSAVVQLLERQLQTLFFETRGAVTPPDDIVILAMDQTSMTQGQQFYSEYPYLDPIARWPWQRTAYAIAIDRLMEAGARAVSVDVLLDLPSSYGPEDDQRLQATLKKYPGKVTLAAKYEFAESREGNWNRLFTPNPIFEVAQSPIGVINFLTDPDGRIYRLGSEYLQTHSGSSPTDPLQQATDPLLSFAEATLQAAQVSAPRPKGETIFFYGPGGTFPSVPFWHVLDPDNWLFHQQNGTFKNKIVVIGSTAADLQDFHAAPFSGTPRYPNEMAGVEVQVNAIATLLENRSIAAAIPNLPLQGLCVLTLVAAAGYLQSTQKRHVARFTLAVGLAFLWGGISYVVFVWRLLTLPVAFPILGIILSGISYLVTGSVKVSSYLENLQYTLIQRFPASIIQDLLPDDPEIRELLRKREQELSGKKLQGRYEITKVLGSGGFGETYIARDTLRPGSPVCVAKRLKPASSHPKVLKLAARLFEREAETLERLGKNHDRIPQLLAFFQEDGEFYLVQEFIEGRSLNLEIRWKQQLPEVKVIALLEEILEILDFIHTQEKPVIHRDIKPNNIIRRKSDGKLVLIDFGAAAVKEKIDQLPDEEGKTNFTVGIGTKGYMPSEQCEGKPRTNSDIYALGMTAIQALTGQPPHQLKDDPDTQEVLWEDSLNYKISRPLADILTKMVRRDFRERYQSATAVLGDIRQLALHPINSAPVVDLLPEESFPALDTDLSESETSVNISTKPWPETFGSTQDIQTTQSKPTDR
jgi:CHASE2 domain-containing sensor protein/serine/threonine protein kinase